MACDSQLFSPQSGDIFACWGSGIVSRGISLETSLTSWLTAPSGLRWSPSHVAIAAQERTSQAVRWWESTSIIERPCLIAGRTIAGVQVHDWRERVRDYVRTGGKVVVYRLAEIDELEAGEEYHLTDLLGSQLGKPYDAISAAISGTRVLKWLPFSRADLDQLFCSELIAAVLQRLCRMNRDNPARYNPGLLLRRLVRQGTYGRQAGFSTLEDCI